MKPSARLMLLLVIFLLLSAYSHASSYNPDVYQAQKKLEALGYDPGKADGIYGKATEQAVKRYQRDYGIPATGLLDRQTLDKLSVRARNVFLEAPGINGNKPLTYSSQNYDTISQNHNESGIRFFLINLFKHTKKVTDIVFPKSKYDGSAFNFFMFGILLFLAVFNLCLFLLTDKDKLMLIFSGFYFFSSFLYVIPDGIYLIKHLPGYDPVFIAKFRLICVFLSYTLFATFIHQLYKKAFNRFFITSIPLICIVFSLAVLLFDTNIHIYLLSIFQIIVIAFGLYVAYALPRVNLTEHSDVLWVFLGLLFLCSAIVNDVLHDQGIISTGYFTPLGVLIFILIQSFIPFLRIKAQTLAYEKFVPKEFLKILDKEDIATVNLGDNAQINMSILFSDIRNFTTLSEDMSPEQNFKFINSFLQVMGPTIRENHGFIDKYIGDAIMALFPRNADDAVQGALGMFENLVDYNMGRDRAKYPPVRIGIGINTGALRIGTVGEAGRMEGTAISDAVNLASRIEGINKLYATSLLISDHTLQSLEDSSKYHSRRIDQVRVDGKVNPVTLWEIFDCDPPEVIDYKLDIAFLFDEAVSFYISKQYKEATELFKNCLTRNASDKTVLFFLDQCHLYTRMGAEKKRDGIARIVTYERLLE